MAKLMDLLNQHLPSVLPPDPAHAISGTELIDKLIQKDAVFADYSGIRSYFTALAQDEQSCLAKVAEGRGYYLRSKASNNASPTASVPREDEVGEAGRAEQPEEKFRAIFMRYAALESVGTFPMLIEHTKGLKPKGDAGRSKWKYPDVVLLHWLATVADEQTGTAEFDENGFKLRESLGERLFRLRSVELKVNVSLANVRESFFQCLSNSRWAHHATLAIASAIQDDKITAELRRLGNAYGVEVKTFGISTEQINGFPDAEKIARMDDTEFAKSLAEPYIKPAIITLGEDRFELDWAYLADVRSLNEDFERLFGWIAFCLKHGKPVGFNQAEGMLPRSRGAKT